MKYCDEEDPGEVESDVVDNREEVVKEETEYHDNERCDDLGRDDPESREDDRKVVKTKKKNRVSKSGKRTTFSRWVREARENENEKELDSYFFQPEPKFLNHSSGSY